MKRWHGYVIELSSGKLIGDGTAPYLFSCARTALAHQIARAREFKSPGKVVKVRLEIMRKRKAKKR